MTYSLLCNPKLALHPTLPKLAVGFTLRVQVPLSTRVQIPLSTRVQVPLSRNRSIRSRLSSTNSDDYSSLPHVSLNLEILEELKVLLDDHDKAFLKMMQAWKEYDCALDDYENAQVVWANTDVKIKKMKVHIHRVENALSASSDYSVTLKMKIEELIMELKQNVTSIDEAKKKSDQLRNHYYSACQEEKAIKDMLRTKREELMLKLGLKGEKPSSESDYDPTNLKATLKKIVDLQLKLELKGEKSLSESESLIVKYAQARKELEEAKKRLKIFAGGSIHKGGNELVAWENYEKTILEVKNLEMKMFALSPEFILIFYSVPHGLWYQFLLKGLE